MYMWFRSTITDKLVNSSYFRTLELVYGADTDTALIANGFLIPVENPSVIDILRDNGSEAAAVLRYREIHGCTLIEARTAVMAMKSDIARISQKYRSVHKKKRKMRQKNREVDVNEETR